MDTIISDTMHKLQSEKCGMFISNRLKILNIYKK